MAFKLKGILNKNVAPALKKNNADIKKMQKLDDEIAKARKLGNKGVVQVLLDKKSKLEDIIMGTTKPPADRPDPTFEGTDEFRKKKDIPKSELKSKGVLRKNGNDKGSEQGTKKGDYTGYGIPDFLYNADGKKFNTANVDEGNLSKIKVEKDTNRKYVVIQDKSVVGDAGGRLYLSNPK